MHRRHLECPRRAREEQERQHAVAGEPSRSRCRAQAQALRAPWPPGTMAATSAAIEPIGDLADHDREHHHRKELHEPHQAEIQGIAGEVVDLPSDRHALHHEGCHCSRCARTRTTRTSGAASDARRRRKARAWRASYYSGMASRVSISRLSRITIFLGKMRAHPPSVKTMWSSITAGREQRGLAGMHDARDHEARLRVHLAALRSPR